MNRFTDDTKVTIKLGDIRYPDQLQILNGEVIQTLAAGQLFTSAQAKVYYGRHYVVLSKNPAHIDRIVVKLDHPYCGTGKYLVGSEQDSLYIHIERADSDANMAGN